MKSLFKLAITLALLCAFTHAQKLDLATQTQGVLPSAQGGRGNTSNGVNGQVLIGDGAGHFVPGDPIVSFNYANLLTAQPATGTSVGSAIRLSTFGTAGTLYVTFASITGSGTSCTVQLKNYDSLGNAINNGSAISVTPANGTTSSAILPAISLQTAAQMSATYACSAYPSAGTISVDFVPAVSVGIAGTVKVDGSGVTQPVSAVSLPLPTGAAQEHTGAASFNASRLTDGAAFYKPTTPSDTQPISAATLPLPSGASQEHTAANSPASVRLTDGTSFFKPTTPSDTQPVSAASLPLPTGAAQDSTLTGGSTKAINRGGAKGSTSAADVTSTASGANHQALDVAQYDASGNQLGLSASPVRTDPTGTTTQPVSGTVTANAGTNLNTSALAVESGGNLATVASAVRAEDTASADADKGIGALAIRKATPANTSSTDGDYEYLQISNGRLWASATIDSALPAGSNTIGSVKLTDGTNTQAVKAASTAAVATDPSAVVAISPNSNTVALVSGQQIKITDGTNVPAVKAASTAAVAADPSLVIQISPNQPQLTTPLNVRGAKTTNNAAPDATELGTLPAVANAAPQSLTEGNNVKLRVDLKGNLLVNNHPPDVLGCYQTNMRTSTYAGLSAGTPLLSIRWTSSTALMVINHLRVNVITTVAATTAGQAEREIIIARSFTASDTGGTAITLTGNNQKMRTSQATSLVGDMRVGTTITAGTRTLDANPIASAIAWLPLNMTGVDIGCNGAGATAAAWSCVSSSGFIDLVNAGNGNDYPIVLAQNEGVIGRIGKDAMPAGATQQTYWQVGWCEVNSF